MAHFAIVAPDEAGHVLPNGNVGSQLVRRGHRVTLLGQRRSATLAEKLNLPFRELSFEDLPRAPSRGLGFLFGLAGAGGIIGMRDHFAWHAEALLRTLPEALRELAVDGLIVDQVAPAAGTVSIQAQTIRSTRVHLTSEKRRAQPTPIMDVVMAWVVETDMPRRPVINNKVAAAVSAAKP